MQRTKNLEHAQHELQYHKKTQRSDTVTYAEAYTDALVDDHAGRVIGKDEGDADGGGGDLVGLGLGPGLAHKLPDCSTYVTVP
jgi:hypothetical protein